MIGDDDYNDDDDDDNDNDDDVLNRIARHRAHRR
jgi:hypothetical protein